MMNHRILLHLICGTLSACLAYADQSVNNREDGVSHPGKTAEDLPKFESVTTIPEYWLTDAEAHDSLRKLGQTKPDIPPNVGVSQFASTWAQINVRLEVKGGDGGDTYVVFIYNEYKLADKWGLAYRIGFVGLSKIDTRNEIAETRFLGYFDNPQILGHLLDFVCDKARIKLPERISPKEQFAPKTTTYYGSGRADDFQTFSDLAKSSKTSPAVTESPLAVILIAPIQRVIRHEETYQVELFATPGLMRISVEKRKLGGDKQLRTVGYRTNTETWLSLRERLRNTAAPHEEGTDALSDPAKKGN